MEDRGVELGVGAVTAEELVGSPPTAEAVAEVEELIDQELREKGAAEVFTPAGAGGRAAV